MLRRALLPVTIGLLIYGFWVSPDFKLVCAGVAIFLYGMLALEDGFRVFAGGILNDILRRCTDKLWKSFAFGVVSTSLVQSSSLVSLLTITFLSSGLISLGGAIGIVFGANLGTTSGAWLVAGLGLKVSLSVYAMPLLVFGVLLVFQRNNVSKGFGYILVGLGFLLLGIDYMKSGFEAFRSSIDLTRFSMEGLPGLLVYTGFGVAATVIMQSSHAVLVLTLAGLAAGQIEYENAMALAIGSNIGTTITAIIGSLGANQDGKRLAAAHLVFNCATALVAIVFIGEFTAAVGWLSTLAGFEDDTLRLALFHTLFNLTGMLLMLPLTGKLERVLSQRFRAPSPAVKQPKYLNEAVKQYADAAVDALQNETTRLYDTAERIIAHAMGLHRDDIHSERDLKRVVSVSRKAIREDINEKYALNVKSLYSAIVEFISDVSAKADVDGRQIELIHLYRTAGARIVESVKAIKHLQKNLLAQMMSPNVVVRDQYDEIRFHVAQTLRAIHTMKTAGSEDVIVPSYDEARVALAKGDLVANGTIDHLIRERSITPAIATSLMNDTAYAFQACNGLLGAAEILFIRGRKKLRPAETALELDDQEIASLAARDPNP